MIWTDCYKELVEIIRGKNEFLASIPDEYSELREQMENTPEIEHIDMWHEQVSFLERSIRSLLRLYSLNLIHWASRTKGYSFNGFTHRLISGCFTKPFPIPVKVRQCRKGRCPSLIC